MQFDLAASKVNAPFHYRAVAVQAGITHYGEDRTLGFAVPLNHPPMAGNDTVYVKRGEAVTFHVLGNDTDPDGDLLGIEPGTSPAFGTLSFDGIGLTYTAGPRFRENDSFTYLLSDGNGGTATATVTLRNRFLDSRGAFAAVLFNEAAPVGMLRVKVTSTGTFTGSLQLGTVQRAIRGSFDFDGKFTQTVTVDGLPYQISMSLNAANGELRGEMERNGQKFLFIGETALAGKALENAPAGLHTLLLPAPPSDAPPGTGWATVTLAKNGLLRLAGQLGNGTPFTASAALRKDASFWLDAKGVLTGNLRFRPLPGSDFDGTLTWKFAPPAGVAPIEAIGARYTVLPTVFTFNAAGSPVADLRSTRTARLDEPIGFSARKPFLLNNPAAIGFSIQPRTGVFSGKFSKMPDGRKRSLGGVIFQKSNSGHGVYTESVREGRGGWRIDGASIEAVTLIPR